MTVTIHEATPTMFHNVQVIALPSIDPVTGATNFDVTFIPVAVTVDTPDAVINYQLIWPTPDDVRFVDMTVLPVDQDQFSEESVSIDGKLLARASGGVDVSAADAALFARFLRYQVGGHPLVLAQLVQMHRVPAKLVFFYRQAASTQEVTLSFAAVKASAPAALPLQGYARHMSDGDGLAALLDRAAIAPVPAAGEIRKALGEEAAAFTDLRALDALLATLEMNLSTGDEPQPFTPAQKAAIELDPSVKELLRALSLKERTDLPEAVATLQALRPKTMRRQYMLKLFEANDRAILGENKAAIELLTGVVHASPGLAGAYKDLGDKLFGAFDMAGAWRCWDAGRRIAPGLKLFDQVNRFEAELLKRHPEYF